MAQFDVHRNAGRTRAAMPYLLVVQSNRWNARLDRVVVPLVLAREIMYRDQTMNPEFVIEGTPVLMNPLQIATVPSRILGVVVTSLDHRHTEIIAALDALIAHGS